MPHMKARFRARQIQEPAAAATRQTGISERHKIILKPMRIDRLVAAGPPYTVAEQARVLYHQLGDVERVADRIGHSVEWTRQVLAHDIEQRLGASRTG